MKKKTIIILLALFVICLFIINATTNNNDYNNRDSYNEGLEKSEEELKIDEQNDEIKNDEYEHISRKEFQDYLMNYIYTKYSSKNITVETKTINGYDEDLALNFVFNKVKKVNEYNKIARIILNDVKGQSINKYIDDKWHPTIRINFYISKSVFNSMIKNGNIKKSYIKYKFPYDIGGYTITKSDYMYQEKDFENSTTKNLISIYGYSE